MTDRTTDVQKTGSERKSEMEFIFRNFLRENSMRIIFFLTQNSKVNFNKNSSGDEIANMNFFYNIAHVEASNYAR